MSAAADPMLNRLLAALPAADLKRLRADLELVELPLGSLLYEPGSALQPAAYFPTTAIVSLVCMMEDGDSAEVAMVGFEGVVGVTLLLGNGARSSFQTIVQSGGHAYRLRREPFLNEFTRPGGVLQQCVLRYAQALLAQIIQTAGCNRHHTVDQQLCRWLLMALDRLRGGEIEMTQELIANMLGVRRGGVTEAAGRLQAAGLIEYRRGRIRVLDRPGLKARVCECYETVQKEYARLLPDAPAR